jgi:hypothetical protein
MNARRGNGICLPVAWPLPEVARPEPAALTALVAAGSFSRLIWKSRMSTETLLMAAGFLFIVVSLIGYAIESRGEQKD